MRTKAEIEQELRDALTSPAWRSLKNSLLGNELIALATNSVYLSEAGYERFYRNLYPETASLGGLCSLSSAYEVPFCNFRPYTCKVRLTHDTVIPPFALKCVIGSVTYTNLSYIDATEETVVTLYQGDVFYTTNYQGSLTDHGITASQTALSLVSDADGISYVTLSTTTIPDSVWLWTEGDGAFLYTLKNAVNSESEAYNFTLSRDASNKLRVTFGDGVTGARLGTTSFVAYYMNATFTNPALPESGSTITLNGTSLQAECLSLSAGLQDSLYEARSQFKSYLAKHSVVATKDQVKAFVESYPSVISSVVETGDLNHVIVYVKPTNPTDTEFEALQEQLRIYGEIVTQYKVVSGSPLQLSIELRSSTPLALDQKSKVTSLVESLTAYEELPYKVSLSPLSISSQILEDAQLSVDVTFKLKQPLSSERVQTLALPTDNVSIYNDSGLIAWTSLGELYGFTASSFIPLQQIFSIGDFTLSTSNQDVYIYDTVNNRLRKDIIQSLSLTGLKDIVEGEDYYLTSSSTSAPSESTSISLFRKTSVWDSSSNIMMSSSSVRIFSFQSGSSSISGGIPQGVYQAVFNNQNTPLSRLSALNGTDLYTVCNLNNTLWLYRFAFTASGSYFSQDPSFSKSIAATNNTFKIINTSKVGNVILVSFMSDNTPQWYGFHLSEGYSCLSANPSTFNSSVTSDSLVDFRATPSIFIAVTTSDDSDYKIVFAEGVSVMMTSEAINLTLKSQTTTSPVISSPSEPVRIVGGTATTTFLEAHPSDSHTILYVYTHASNTLTSVTPSEAIPTLTSIGSISEDQLSIDVANQLIPSYVQYESTSPLYQLNNHYYIVAEPPIWC